MKKFIFLSAIIFISCDSIVDKGTKDIIPIDKMELILFDIQIMHSISKSYNSKIEEKDWFGSEYIYKKYGIDSMKLSHSQDYYSKKPDLYLSIHKNILKRMQNSIDSIDKLVKSDKTRLIENKFLNKKNKN